MDILNLKVKRIKNSFYGNPRYSIVSWDSYELLKKLQEKKKIKFLKSGWVTSPNEGYVYSLLNQEGVVIDDIKVIATL